jgi:hypothetical protein
MELEIKGFIQFCRFLSQHPQKIVDNESLVPILDFCFDAITKCDCQSGKIEKVQAYEQQFEEKIKSIEQNMLSVLASILDEKNNFSDIFISFPISGEKIKVK